MEKLYKLTDEKGGTCGGMQWGVNVTHRANPPLNYWESRITKGKIVVKNVTKEQAKKKRIKREPRLCTDTVIHAYRNKNLAFLINYRHAGFPEPRIYSARGKVVVDDGAKVGCLQLTTIRKLQKPKWIGHKKERLVRKRFSDLSDSNFDSNVWGSIHYTYIDYAKLADQAVKEVMG